MTIINQLLNWISYSWKYSYQLYLEMLFLSFLNIKSNWIKFLIVTLEQSFLYIYYQIILLYKSKISQRNNKYRERALISKIKLKVIWSPNGLLKYWLECIFDILIRIKDKWSSHVMVVYLKIEAFIFRLNWKRAHMERI